MSQCVSNYDPNFVTRFTLWLNCSDYGYITGHGIITTLDMCFIVPVDRNEQRLMADSATLE